VVGPGLLPSIEELCWPEIHLQVSAFAAYGHRNGDQEMY
jgi:hypothetical protein